MRASGTSAGTPGTFAKARRAPKNAMPKSGATANMPATKNTAAEDEISAAPGVVRYRKAPAAIQIACANAAAVAISLFTSIVTPPVTEL